MDVYFSCSDIDFKKWKSLFECTDLSIMTANRLFTHISPVTVFNLKHCFEAQNNS